MTTFDDDFNDSLDNLFDRSHLPKQAGELPSIRDQFKPVEQRIERIATVKLFEENCKKCGGSGRFRGFTGRDFGPCFACKGKGKFEFKTDAATRAHAKTLREERKQRHITEAHDTFKEHNPEAYAWLLSRAPRFAFAQSMLDAITKWGSLTGPQHDAVLRLVEKDKQRAAATTVEIDATKVQAAFEHARANRHLNEATDNDVGVIDKWPTLRLD